MKNPLLLKHLVFYFSLLISSHLFSQSANNTCATATNMGTINSSCTSATGDLYLANQTSPAGSTCGNRYDVWYRFTMPAGTNSAMITVTLTSNPTSIATNNTFIELFNTNNCTVAGTSTGGCNDITAPRRYTGLTGGAIYYFRVNTTVNPNANPSRWGFSVCVKLDNDDCANAEVITPGQTLANGSAFRATASAGITVGCATGTPDDDVWYKFTALYSYATITLHGIGGDLNTSGARMQLFSGACAGFTSLACSNTLNVINATGLVPGDTYHIRVYSSGANPQTGTAWGFSISLTPSAKVVVSAGRMKELYHQQIISAPQVLADPWEVTYGPDNNLWITESKGYRLYKMNPTTGVRDTVLDISQGSTFLPIADQTFNCQFNNGNGAQGGFAGMALHPQFLAPSSPQNFVYVSYIRSQTSGTVFTNRVVRFTYNTGTGKLGSPVSLCDSIPGSSDHNSQRMIIIPVGGTDYLFYAAGDMGSGQFGNAMRLQKAQTLNSYEGKILRFNLIPDADAGTLDRWIPNDNPFNVTLGVQSAVWARGIRNNQGFAYDASADILYGSSHGPFSDDEINIIESGRNYGHPLVIGYAADDNANGTTAGASPGMSPAHPSSCPVITDESNNATALGAAYKDPLFAGYPSSVAFPSLNALWNSTTGANAQWPSEGWSGLDLATTGIVPGWKKSLIASSLKWGRLVKIRLGTAGNTVVQSGGADTVSYFGSTNRFRDVAIAPGGKDMYVIMDRSSTTSGPSAANPIIPACGGCVQKYTFLGYADAAGVSTIPTSIDVTDATVNICNPGTTVTIDDENNNLWVPITGPDGNIMAEINAVGQNLGTITSSFYKHSGPIRIQSGVHYLNRSMTITPAVTSFGTPVKVRLYISKAEFDALDADALSGLTGTGNIGLLRVLKNNDPCAATVTSGTTLLTPTNAGVDLVHGTNGYVLQVNVTGFSSFFFATSNMSLPVTLLSFTGSLQNNATLLNWETANEINASHFIVERSIDNASFDGIGTVAANGTTSSNTNYAYTDNDVTTLPSNVIYYRLKMVDIDGSSKYSNTIVINLADIAGRVSVYPNPASHSIKVMIAAVADGKGQWKIADNSGRVVMQNTTTLRQGNNNVVIDINKLAAGLYYLTVSGPGIDQKVKLQKL